MKLQRNSKIFLFVVGCFLLVAAILALSCSSIESIPILGLPQPDEIIKRAVANQIVKSLGETIQTESPIISTPQDIFPTVNSLPGRSFNPTIASSQIIKQIRNSSDGSVMLPPGDYVVPVHLYCMKASSSSPSGHRYALAPLRGKMADVITTLNARVVGSDIPPSDIQTLSWHIQAGMKYQEMSPKMRSLFDRLLPEYKSRFTMSFYEKILRVWDQLALTTPDLPSLDESLSELGDVGRTIVALQQTREALFRYSNDFESLSSTLVTLGTSSLLGESARTPWSRINNRIYGRMVTDGNYMSPGKLQMRITPILGSAHIGKVTRLAFVHTSSIATSGIVLPVINQPLVKVPITSLVANPRDAGIQPLSMSPEEEEEEEKLVSITVVSGATKKNVTGQKNWAAVKAQNQDVIIVATTDPDTIDAWKKIWWYGGTPVPSSPNKRKITISESKKYHVEAALGGVSDFVNVWAIWATIEIKDKGKVPANAAPFDVGMRDETDNLGAVTYQSITGSMIDGEFYPNMGASAKVVGVATLTPKGIHEVVKSGWSFKRQQKNHTWTDGLKAEESADKWTNDHSKPAYLRLTPDSDDNIYDTDAPDIRWANKTWERYINFRQWIEWNDEKCSDYALWSWRVRWRKHKELDKQITLNDLQVSKNPSLPSKPTP